MIDKLQENPYIYSQAYYNELDDYKRNKFLESLYEIVTKKTIIFARFLESHPFFEDYIISNNLLPKDIHLLDNSYSIINESMKIKQDFLPNIIFSVKEHVEVIIYEPFNQAYKVNMIEQIRALYNNNVKFYICKQDFFNEITLSITIQNYFKSEVLHNSLIFSLLQFAIRINASDIHLFLQNDKANCILRIDGSLINFLEFSKELFVKISQKLKLLCQIDINENRIPQDGHFRMDGFAYGDSKNEICDIRSSFFPTPNGESIVLRIPNANKRFFSLDTLNLNPYILNILKKSLLTKSGLIIISGPTGSAKSTLLYNCLRFLHNGTKKIITIEDPIEQEINGIVQCQINEDLDLTFARALKYMLRQDPDIIMIGEIRDYDTLEIAMRAALTGHLVLASIHSSDCISSVARLRDLGAKDYVLKATLRLIISQRLVQTLCPFCKVEHNGMCKANGCYKCYNQGHGHRILLQEIMDFCNNNIDFNLFKYDCLESLESCFCNIPTIKKQAQELLRQGIISYEESLF